MTVGTILSMVFLILYLLRHRDSTPSDDVPRSSGYLLRRILAIGVPITLGNCAMSIITMIDTKIILGRLQTGLGLTEVAASALKGQYSYAMDMLNMVASFVYPVTMSLIPFAAAALAQGDKRGASRTVNSAFRILALLALAGGRGPFRPLHPHHGPGAPRQREALSPPVPTFASWASPASSSAS